MVQMLILPIVEKTKYDDDDDEYILNRTLQ